MSAQRKMLSVFIDKADQWKERSLFEAIVYILERNGIAGATVIDGIMGYGVHRRVHRKGLFGVSDEKPIVIVAVDEEDRLRSVVPKIAATVKEGLLTLQDVEVVPLGEKLSSGDSST